MKLSLPPKTRRLIEHYFNINVGGHKFPCPYYQNVTHKKSRAVFVGKGTPSEIESETENLFKKMGKEPKNLDPATLRHYMVMAGIGIDCSGFATRVMVNFLKEKGAGSIRSLRPDRSLLSQPMFFLRPYTNLSADGLTSKTNCIEIKNIDDVLPGDLIKIGKGHVAIVSGVEKENGKSLKIEYCHSTSDYLDQHGVRKGAIFISLPGKSLEKQRWDEFYRNKNWNLEDYIKAESKNRGFRRLKALV